MSPFSAPFSGAPKSEGFCFQGKRLLYRREPNAEKGWPLNQEDRRGVRAESIRAENSGARKRSHGRDKEKDEYD